ncbi:MAG: hypothetical protein DRP63_07035 [Planctomycetota bacterium]|nr:MAG: hypothetical protein DRP63_07035 [Planctomycetota bacterium]
MSRRKTCYVFVTGGVVSSLGKGLTSASVAMLLERHGLKVSIQKIDPYINVDPGTMSPFQHGEVYVTEDGAETDLDLGHYERFTNCRVDRRSNFTTGRVYYNVIRGERRGRYLGKTVQVVPHITDEIKRLVKRAARGADVLVSELGGTVGDIEGLPFLEAIRQMRLEEPECVLNIHITLLPHLHTTGELKTKPTQHSVGRLREIGIQPDILICRTSVPMGEEERAKISLFCNVPKDAVIEERDVDISIYEVPVELHKQKLDLLVLQKLGLRVRKECDLSDWEAMLEVLKNPEDTVRIAVVGKYVRLRDSYKSINEALCHGGIQNRVRVEIVYVESEEVAEKGTAPLEDVHGILVPGGFGVRGIEGKIETVKFAREHHIPFFGICLGMQTAVIEFVRNVVGLKEADSREFNEKTPHPVIDYMPKHLKLMRRRGMGGTMRLGAYDCRIKEGTKAYQAYRTDLVRERHRHRLEVNPRYTATLERHGLRISGVNPQTGLAEIVELVEHPWFVGVQFHPEFKSKPLKAHPLFAAFVRAALNYKYRLLTQFSSGTAAKERL